MALTATEEAQVKALIAQNAALLSLASSEPTIISKLAATKVSLADLTAASTVSDSDLFLVRQGSTEKSITKSVLAPIATNAEAQAFTAGKLIDGAKLAAALQGANQSLTANGYQKLPGGLVFQWGTYNVTCNQGPVNGFYYSNPTAFSFPTAFASSCLIAIATPLEAVGVEGSATLQTKTTSSASFVGHNTTSGVVQTLMVFAIGF